MNEKDLVEIIEENINDAEYKNFKPSGWSIGECETWYFSFDIDDLYYDLRFHPYSDGHINLIWLEVKRKYKKFFGNDWDRIMMVRCEKTSHSVGATFNMNMNDWNHLTSLVLNKYNDMKLRNKERVLEELVKG